LAIDAKTGQELWQFQTGFGADAPLAVYEVNGEEYIAIATRGNQGALSANGDAVWALSLKGQLGPLWPPPAAEPCWRPAGPVADGVDTIKIGDNNVEYSYWPARTLVKAGTMVTFTNVGDVQHTATAFEKGKWDTGVLINVGQRLLPFPSPVATITSAYRTPGCTAKSSSSKSEK
jgi:alcohol dehydrogenase (cytochrome c)